MPVDLPPTPFLLSELADVGLTRATLRAKLKEGVVRRVLHGVYVRADVPDTQNLRAACAAKVLPPHCVVTDRSAAWLHGIDCFDLVDLDDPPILEVVSVRGNERTRRSGILGGERALLDVDVCEIAGVRVTTPLRTACDLACQRGRHRALAVLDAFRRRFDLRIPDFLQILPRYARRRGVTQLRELVPLSDPRAESTGESWTRMTIHDEGLPAPEPQVEVYLEELAMTVRLDLAYRQRKTCVEYDGEDYHTDPADRAYDDRRRAALRRAGWIVIVVRKDGFSGTAREAWLRMLRNALAERAPYQGKRRYARGESLGHPRRR
jgi:hypothetical protein